MYKRALISARALCLGRSISAQWFNLGAVLAPAYALRLWEMEKLHRLTWRKCRNNRVFDSERGAAGHLVGTRDKNLAVFLLLFGSPALPP